MNRTEEVSLLKQAEALTNNPAFDIQKRNALRQALQQYYGTYESNAPEEIAVNRVEPEFAEFKDDKTFANIDNAIAFYKDPSGQDIARDLAYSKDASEITKRYPQFKGYKNKQLIDAAKNFRNIFTEDESVKIMREVESLPMEQRMDAADALIKQRYSPAESRDVRNAVQQRFQDFYYRQTGSPVEQGFLGRTKDALMRGLSRLSETNETILRKLGSGAKYMPMGGAGVILPSKPGQLEEDYRRSIQDELKASAYRRSAQEGLERNKAAQTEGGFVERNITSPIVEMAPQLAQTIAAGAVTGGAGAVASGFLQGSALFSNDMIDSGVSPDIANLVSPIGGAIYGAIETAQVDRIAPGSGGVLKKIAGEKIKKWLGTESGRIVAKSFADASLKTGGKILVEGGKEAVEESLQQLTQDISFDTAAAIQNELTSQGVSYRDAGEIARNAARAFAESIIPMTALLTPKGAIRAAQYRKGIEVQNPEQLGLDKDKRYYQEAIPEGVKVPAVNQTRPETSAQDFINALSGTQQTQEQVAQEPVQTTPEAPMIREVESNEPAQGTNVFAKRTPAGVVDWRQILQGKEQTAPLTPQQTEAATIENKPVVSIPEIDKRAESIAAGKELSDRRQAELQGMQESEISNVPEMQDVGYTEENYSQRDEVLRAAEEQNRIRQELENEQRRKIEENALAVRNDIAITGVDKSLRLSEINTQLADMGLEPLKLGEYTSLLKDKKEQDRQRYLAAQEEERKQAISDIYNPVDEGEYQRIPMRGELITTQPNIEEPTNAIQERSTETAPMAEAARTSQEMGERVPVEAEPTRTQEQAEPVQQSETKSEVIKTEVKKETPVKVSVLKKKQAEKTESSQVKSFIDSTLEEIKSRAEVARKKANEYLALDDRKKYSAQSKSLKKYEDIYTDPNDFIADIKKNPKVYMDSNDTVETYIERKAERIKAEVSKRKLPSKIIKVVNTQEDLPDDVKKSAENSKIRGAYFYDNGVPQVYLVAENLKIRAGAFQTWKELDATIEHEFKTHFGLDAMHPSKAAFEKAMLDIGDKFKNDSGWKQAIAHVEKNYPQLMQAKERDSIKALINEEALAHIAGQNTLWSKKVVNYIKGLIEDLTGFKFSDYEIRDLLKRSAEFARNKGYEFDDKVEQKPARLLFSQEATGSFADQYKGKHTGMTEKEIEFSKKTAEEMPERKIVNVETARKEAEKIFKENSGKVFQSIIDGTLDEKYNPYVATHLISLSKHLASEKNAPYSIMNKLYSAALTRRSEFGSGLGSLAHENVMMSNSDMQREQIASGIFEPTIDESRELASSKTNDAKRKQINDKMQDRAERIKKKLEAEGLPGNPYMLSDKQLNDPDVIGKYTRIISSENSHWLDKLSEWRTNAMLSGLVTHAVNLSSTAAKLGWDAAIQTPTKAAINNFVDMMQNIGLFVDSPLIGDSSRSRYKLEDLKYAYSVFAKSYKDIMAQAKENASKAFQTEHGQLTADSTKLEFPRTAIGGKAGRAIRIPVRAIMAGDEALTTIAYNFQLALNATAQARLEGLKKGTPEFDKRYVELMNSKPDSEFGKKALRIALEQTFKGESGSIVNKLLELKRSGTPAQRFATNMIFPFVKTPAAIFRQAYEMSPLGMISVIKGSGTGDDQLRILANSITGIALLAATASMIGDDNDEDPFITGSLPVKVGEKEAAYNIADPYTIKLGDKRISYRKFEPFATLLGGIVDTVKQAKAVKRGKDVDEAFSDVLSSYAKAMSDKTFIAALGDIINLVNVKQGSLKNNVQRLATNWISSWMPNILKQPARAADSNVRSFVGMPYKEQVLFQTAPFLSWYDEKYSPPSKVDIWGRDVEKSKTAGLPFIETPPVYSDLFYRALMPGEVLEKKNIDNYTRLLINWNNNHPNETYNPTTLNKAYIIKKGIKMPLTQDEFYKLAKLSGKYAKEIMDRHDFKSFSNPTEDDIEIMKKALSAGRKRAGNEIFGKDNLVLAEQYKVTKDKTLKDKIENRLDDSEE